MKILFDIGGTKTRVGASKDGENLFGEPIVFPTPAEDFEKCITQIFQAAKTLAGEEKIESALGGIAGPMDESKSSITRPGHLPDFANRPLKKALEEALEAQVRLENDAALAGLGEARFGAGKGVGIAAYLTVGTGLGGARIVNGEIDNNSRGFEPGAQIINSEEGFRRAEELVSGTAVKAKFGISSEEMKDEDAWKTLAGDFSAVLNNAAVFWSPDVIVIGGSLPLLGPEIFMREAQREYEKMLEIFSSKPAIKKAELGDFCALWGAMHLAFKS